MTKLKISQYNAVVSLVMFFLYFGSAQFLNADDSFGAIQIKGDGGQIFLDGDFKGVTNIKLL